MAPTTILLEIQAKISTDAIGRSKKGRVHGMNFLSTGSSSSNSLGCGPSGTAGMVDPRNDDIRESLGIVHFLLDNHDSWMQYIREALHKLIGVPILPNLAWEKQHRTNRSQDTVHEDEDDGDDDE
ncbi:hypothetical protein CDL15_Pgr011968 [Punica granatum]|uniref:Uncharacterized protein n=1 Tax=Punica granatum TaxID=22663 RepID=A0A218WEL9_PUNGR|nr:hypothetical protein CDL15_Pgr011968 [Punica granatum]PKI78617.1 hypothetical protein CRG98_000994 [Punica granatum]